LNLNINKKQFNIIKNPTLVKNISPGKRHLQKLGLDINLLNFWVRNDKTIKMRVLDANNSNSYPRSQVLQSAG
jgi:hypothetical protein